MGFAGQYGVLQEPNGLYYMNARYYDPKIGRFISEDPLGIGGGDMTLYSYANNNPWVFVDPSGLCASNVGNGYTSSSFANALHSEMQRSLATARPALVGTMVLAAVGTGAAIGVEVAPIVATTAQAAWPYIATTGITVYQSTQNVAVQVQSQLNRIPGYYNFLLNNVINPAKPPIKEGIQHGINDIRN